MSNDESETFPDLRAGVGRLRASADAWWDEYDREAAAHEVAKAEVARLTRIVNGYDRTPSEQRAADAEAEVDRLTKENAELCGTMEPKWADPGDYSGGPVCVRCGRDAAGTKWPKCTDLVVARCPGSIRDEVHMLSCATYWNHDDPYLCDECGAVEVQPS